MAYRLNGCWAIRMAAARPSMRVLDVERKAYRCPLSSVKAAVLAMETRTMSRFLASPSALSPLGPDHVSHVRTTRELHHRGEVTVNEGSADLHPQDAQGMRGKVVVERGSPDLAPSFLNADHVRALEGVDGAHVGAGDV